MLRTFQPSLGFSAGEDALRIGFEEADGITLLVDDISRTGSSPMFMRTVECWAGYTQERHAGGLNPTIIVPLRPDEAVGLLQPTGTNSRSKPDMAPYFDLSI